jgi:hypothetical protein
VELLSAHDQDFGEPPQDKRNAPLQSLSVCCCLRVSQDNRMTWLRRVILWNDIAKAIFIVVVVVVVLAVILPSALHT